MKKIICQLHGVWKLRTDWYIRTEKDFNKTVWNMQKYILAYKMHPQYQQSHNRVFSFQEKDIYCQQTSLVMIPA